MSATTEQVFIEAPSLPTRARATLVHKLLLSLESEEGSPEIEAAWKEEAIERCKAYDEGRMTERDAAEVLRDAYQKLKYRELPDRIQVVAVVHLSRRPGYWKNRLSEK